MKKLLLTLAALPMAAYAGQASAQVYGNASGAVTVQNRIANLEARYNAGLQAGAFSNSERSALHRQLVELRAMERSYSYDGLSDAERRALQQRIRQVRDQLRMAGRSDWANSYGWDDRDLDAHASAYGTGAYDAYGRPVSHGGVVYDQYGRVVANPGVTYDAYGRPITNGGAVYDQYGRVVANRGVTYDAYGRPIPNGGVVYDQYGRAVPNSGVVYDQYGRAIPNSGVVYDQYGRPVADGRYGQGGPYEPVQQRSGVGNALGNLLGNMVGGGGGVGGLLGSILGRGGLRTGDVITSTIASVLGSAMGFGSRYRDTNSVYYRSDGQRVYEIDARTHRVIRIHPINR
ncbi:MAG: hypothetical protein M3177_03585 [Pseudomonadota bacterium]|nr:hypothetical protein [Pseudomonadota bacterium]